MKYLALLAFMACIPAANWMIGNVGECHPNGPCVIPVWPGIYAPSGVLMIGFALTLRDVVHRQFGLWWALGAVACGAVFSWGIAPASLAMASVAAYAASEAIDTAVYHPLRKRGFALAMAASSAVGLVVDSLLFLWIAFGSFDFAAGQIIGKAWAVLLVVTLVMIIRRRHVAAAE